jgi:AraC-like DNA-binding protein
MKLYIKYMVSIRCISAVKKILKDCHIQPEITHLGEIEIPDSTSKEQLNQLQSRLLDAGFELMEDKKAQMIERTVNVIIDMIHNQEESPKINYSEYISQRLNFDYTYISNVFSHLKGITIQHFIIIHKIERIKELIIYNELTISEIAWKLNYSSAAHLSNQFKKMTGLSPSTFKALKIRLRTPIENIGKEAYLSRYQQTATSN